MTPAKSQFGPMGSIDTLVADKPSSKNSQIENVKIEQYDDFIKVKYSDGTSGVINFTKDDSSKLHPEVKSAYGIKDSKYVSVAFNLSQKKEHQLINANVLKAAMDKYVAKNSDVDYMITSDIDTNKDMFKDYQKKEIKFGNDLGDNQYNTKTVYVKDMKAAKSNVNEDNINKSYKPDVKVNQEMVYNRAN